MPWSSWWAFSKSSGMFQDSDYLFMCQVANGQFRGRPFSIQCDFRLRKKNTRNSSLCIFLQVYRLVRYLKICCQPSGFCNHGLYRIKMYRKERRYLHMTSAGEWNSGNWRAPMKPWISPLLILISWHDYSNSGSQLWENYVLAIWSIWQPREDKFLLFSPHY